MVVVDRNLLHVQSVVFPVGSLVSAFLWEVRGIALSAAPIASAFFRPSPPLKKFFSYALNCSGKNTVLPLQEIILQHRPLLDDTVGGAVYMHAHVRVCERQEKEQSHV